MATDRDFITFQQARAIVAHTAAEHYNCGELLSILISLGSNAALHAAATPLQLGYRIAWMLLPAGADITSTETTPLDCSAVLCRTDSRTGGPRA